MGYKDITFLLICGSFITICCYPYRVPLSDIFSKTGTYAFLQQVQDFDLLKVSAVLGIAIYVLYLLYYIKHNGFLNMTGTDATEKTYTSIIFLLTNVLYVGAAMPLTIYTIFSGHRDIVWQGILIMVSFIIYLIFRHLLTDLTEGTNSGHGDHYKLPFMLDYIFLEKVREYRTGHRRSHCEDYHIIAARNDYSHIIFNIMFVLLVMCIIFNSNVVTLLLVEFSLLYAYIYTSALETLPKCRYQIVLSSVEQNGNNSYNQEYYNVYFYKNIDFYILVGPFDDLVDGPKWVNGSTILSITPIDTYRVQGH